MWGVATLMVTIVSCCSLIGISIMPLISGPRYKSFITLFTGLAVGSLLGSAIFSLIPQAFSLHLQQDKSYLWKSLVIFFGIYLFYCSERLMRIYFDRKTRRKLEKEQKQQIPMRKNKSSSKLQQDDNGTGSAITGGGDQSRTKNNGPFTEISLAKDHSCDEEKTQTHPSMSVEQLHHHGHSHGHSHFHDLNHEQILSQALKKGGPPVRRAEIAPVAWMIIIGDGLHNFIDGLSIGAAFSDSIVLGMSTSVAVIFEEFPHELGDFAVLISSGMSVRQALGFNFLSACTCYIGMVVGILLGDLTQSASFIFALAGGMFLYISLVDMMGELSAMLEECKDSTREVSHLLLMQNIGILSGIIIIFILSLYSTGWGGNHYQAKLKDIYRQVMKYETTHTKKITHYIYSITTSSM